MGGTEHLQMSSFAVTPNRLVLNDRLFIPEGRKKVWVREVISRFEAKVDGPGLFDQRMEHADAISKR